MMAKDNNTKAIDIDQAVHKYREQLTKITNESGLPITVIALLAREFANEMSAIERNSAHLNVKKEKNDN